MNSIGQPTVGEMLEAYRAKNELDPQPAASATWTFQIGPITIRLPNFQWRRRAIIFHDLHHMMTGYPCTMRGECQMAAWEFAAGRFPHALATSFCLPLVALGVVWTPRSTWSAFISGRRSKSLYGSCALSDILRQPIETLPKATPNAIAAPAHMADIIAFFMLVIKAAAIVLCPIGILTSAVFAVWL